MVTSSSSFSSSSSSPSAKVEGTLTLGLMADRTFKSSSKKFHVVPGAWVMVGSEGVGSDFLLPMENTSGMRFNRANKDSRGASDSRRLKKGSARRSTVVGLGRGGGEKWGGRRRG